MIIADINQAAARPVAASIGLDTAHYGLDVSDRAACDALAAQVGPISILVNNAGIFRRGKLEADTARTDWPARIGMSR